MALIEKRLVGVVRAQVSALAQAPDSSASVDLDQDLTSFGINSMAGLAILKRINAEFGVSIKPSEAPSLNTLRKIVDRIESDTA